MCGPDKLQQHKLQKDISIETTLQDTYWQCNFSIDVVNNQSDLAVQKWFSDKGRPLILHSSSCNYTCLLKKLGKVPDFFLSKEALNKLYNLLDTHTNLLIIPESMQRNNMYTNLLHQCSGLP
ncbi:hypothetical protein PROFUN_16082 [Planoprotostelium fungivorum]|uniref:Uncharacterized protein n=1 Tax=Planoprotostelium fungivorum TaxID=1890364 RepID=A0A2P6MXF1_9EUKA|nr:hypothetical protein PROFUN_16082 [Planoprotostelium fungivorum]